MDLIKAVSIIGRDLEEALALLEQLSTIKSTHTAEIELARLRIRSASELLRLLPALERPEEPARINTLEQQKAQDPHKIPEPVRAARAVEMKTEAAEEAAVMNFAAQEPHQIREQIQKPVTEQVTEPLTAPVTAPVTEKVSEKVSEEVTEPHRMQENAKAPEALKSILADRFASAGTFGEKMQSAKHDEMVSSVMHSKPIADIAAAIGMNDKFYFIRELFSGDSIAYNDTIRRLNAAASLGEAMRILDESTVMGSDPAAQSSFVDVVRRKFNVHV